MTRDRSRVFLIRLYFVAVAPAVSHCNLLSTIPTRGAIFAVRDANFDSACPIFFGGEPLDFGTKFVSPRRGRGGFTAEEVVSLLSCLWYARLWTFNVQAVRFSGTHVTHHPSTVMLLMLFAPHPSWLIILIHHHLLTLKSWRIFATHLLISYTLMFLACTSLIVCLARDPGPTASMEDDQRNDEETSLTEALMAPVDDDFNSPEKWCKKCWAAKPERTHHCSICRRCVLKMGKTATLCSSPSRTNRHGPDRPPLPVDGK